MGFGIGKMGGYLLGLVGNKRVNWAAMFLESFFCLLYIVGDLLYPYKGAF